MSGNERSMYSIEQKYLKEIQDIKNRNLINKIRAYDTEMLHLHKLRKRLRADPRRELPFLVSGIFANFCKSTLFFAHFCASERA